MSYEEVMARLSADTRKQVLPAAEIHAERLRTPSLSLNADLGGGLGYGRQVTIWGTKSAGKSALCLQTIAKAQAEGKVCGWIDVENSFVSSWATKLGVNTKELILTRGKTTAKITDSVVNMMQSGVDVVCIDSISAIVPSAYLEKDGELKPFADQSAMGALSRDLGKMMSDFNMVNDNTLLLLISQERMAPKGPMYWGRSPMGGKALEYYTSQGIQVSTTPSDAIKGITTEGDRVFEAQVGSKVKYLVVWNKLGPQGRSGSWDFYYHGDHLGIDSVAEVIDYALEFELIKTTSAGRFQRGEQKWHGRTNLIQYFRDSQEEFLKLEAEVLGRI